MASNQNTTPTVNNNTRDTLELVDKIQQFLASQVELSAELSDSAKESLAVAIECIEQAFGTQRKPASSELLDVYTEHKRRQQQPPATNIMQNLASTFMNIASVGQQAATNIQEGQQQQQQTAQTTAANTNDNESAPKMPKARKIVGQAEKTAAESFKNQGNDYMKQEKYQEAYDAYTRAIEIDDNNAIYYSNRAAALARLNDNQGALRDCEEAIEIDPNYSKAYGRMGLAYASMENHQKAKEAYIRAVELDPTNESYKNNLAIAEAKLAETASGSGSSVSGATNIASMISSMINNPEVMNMAMRTLQDPNALQSVFNFAGSAMGGASASGGATQTSADSNPPSDSPSGQVDGGTARSDSTNQQQQQGQQTQRSTPTTATNRQPSATGATGSPFGLANLSGVDILGTGQQVLSAFQNNPELMDNMRRVMTSAFTPPQNRNPNAGPPPPGYS